MVGARHQNLAQESLPHIRLIEFGGQADCPAYDNPRAYIQAHHHCVMDGPSCIVEEHIDTIWAGFRKGPCPNPMRLCS